MKLELDKPENWIQIFDKTVIAIKVTNIRHAPIPVIKVEADIDQRILAVQVTSFGAKNTWNSAGYLSQLNTSISNALGTTSQIITKRKLWLNQINLLMFPRSTLNYRVSFAVPSWFSDVTVKVFKYVGSEIDSTDLLLEMRQEELQRIESKIDAL